MQVPNDGIGAPTASKQTGKFAGSKLIGYGGKGLTVVGAGFDIASLLNSDDEGKEQARELATNLVNQGYTNYDEVMALAQANPVLESAIGDIGFSDYAKTLAGIGLQSGDLLLASGAGAAGGPIGMGAGALLGLGSGLIGSAAQIDLQRKKAKRNQAFRETFENELIARGLA